MKADLFTYLVDMHTHERETMRYIAREIYSIRTYFGSACYKLFAKKPEGESMIARARAEHHARCAGDDNWRRYTGLEDW